MIYFKTSIAFALTASITKAVGLNSNNSNEIFNFDAYLDHFFNTLDYELLDSAFKFPEHLSSDSDALG